MSRGGTFQGKPCVKCGATLRYDVRGQCVACAKASAVRQKQRREAARAGKAA